jgi:hypothetical protein
MTTSSPPDVTTTLARLEAELSAMLDPLDVPFSWTQRERDAHEAKRQQLLARIETVRRASATLADVEPRLDLLTTWHQQLTAWRAALVKELLTIDDKVLLGKHINLTISIRAIDRGRAVVDDTGWSLSTLRLGELMRDAGYRESAPTEGRATGDLPWHGALPDVERKLRELTQRRDDARRRLDAVLASVS